MTLQLLCVCVRAHTHIRTFKEEEKLPEASEMECSSSIYSENGCCCEIPFEYGGESHTNCTLMDYTSFWCYVQVFLMHLLDGMMIL